MKLFVLLYPFPVPDHKHSIQSCKSSGEGPWHVAESFAKETSEITEKDDCNEAGKHVADRVVSHDADTSVRRKQIWEVFVKTAVSCSPPERSLGV
jgi:hypothetical protein